MRISTAENLSLPRSNIGSSNYKKKKELIQTEKSIFVFFIHTQNPVLLFTSKSVAGLSSNQLANTPVDIKLALPAFHHFFLFFQIFSIGLYDYFTDYNQLHSVTPDSLIEKYDSYILYISGIVVRPGAMVFR